ncbi:unnamed protein product [Closterium sp. Naga37s-1]|nr:unnamed protein product [Closterium sp. Naga37s-1]
MLPCSFPCVTAPPPFIGKQMLSILQSCIDTKFTAHPIHSSPIPLYSFRASLSSPVLPRAFPCVTVPPPFAEKQMLSILQSCIGTKFTSRFDSLMAELAVDAVTTVAVEGNCHLPPASFLQPCLALPNSLCGDNNGGGSGGRKDIDIKQYAKVEKVLGGRIEDSAVLRGVMFNKDGVAPSKMRRRIKNPRVVLLDSPLE